MQHSVLTRQSGHTVHPDKVCLTVSYMHAHPVQGLASLRTLDYNKQMINDAVFWDHLHHSITFLQPFSDFIHQIEANCPSLGRSYVGIMQLDAHVRASTDRWQSEPDLAEYADQVLKTWERRVKGDGQVTPILQAAHVAAYLLDPMFVQVRKTSIGLPVVPDEHEQMVNDLIKRVGGRVTAVEFEQLRLEGYADHLKEPAQACADTGVSVASVGSKRARTCAVALAKRKGKGFWWRNGQRKYPDLAKVALRLLALHQH